ncbi:hypothetical protein L345_14165, partial [Ophiophagus hannah]
SKEEKRQNYGKKATQNTEKQYLRHNETKKSSKENQQQPDKKERQSCNNYLNKSLKERGDACDSNPCENGGICVSGLDGFYICECPDGITDSNCSNVMEVDFPTLDVYEAHRIGLHISLLESVQHNILENLKTCR